MKTGVGKSPIIMSSIYYRVILIILASYGGRALAAERADHSSENLQPLYEIPLVDIIFDTSLAEYIVVRPDGWAVSMIAKKDGSMIIQWEESRPWARTWKSVHGQIPEGRLHEIHQEVQRLRQNSNRGAMRVSGVGVHEGSGLEYLKYLIIRASRDVERASPDVASPTM